MIQYELLAYAVLVFAQRGDAPSNSGHMLAHRQVEALDKRCVDLPTARRKHLLDGFQGAKHHAVAHVHQTPAAHGLDHLRIEQLGQGHPAWLGYRPCGLATSGLYPAPEMGEQRGRILLEAIRVDLEQAVWRLDMVIMLELALRLGIR